MITKSGPGGGGASPQAAVGRSVLDMLHPLPHCGVLLVLHNFSFYILYVYIFLKSLFWEKAYTMCLCFQTFTFMKKKTLRMVVRTQWAGPERAPRGVGSLFSFVSVLSLRQVEINTNSFLLSRSPRSQLIR